MIWNSDFHARNRFDRRVMGVSLVELLTEVGCSAFANEDTFACILKTPSRSSESELAVTITEEGVAGAFVQILREASSSPRVKNFVHALSQLKPDLSWQDVFDQIGPHLAAVLAEEELVLDESAWGLLLEAWQECLSHMQKQANGMQQEEREEGEIDSEPKTIVMFPLTALPNQPSVRLLSMLASFLVTYDLNEGTDLVRQTLFEFGLSTPQLELAHTLFYKFGDLIQQKHQVDLKSFLNSRLNTNPRLFIIKLGIFLYTKLSALHAVFLAATQGKDPLQTIDTNATLMLDAQSCVTYFKVVLQFAETCAADARRARAVGEQPSPAALLFEEGKIAQHFETLRSLVCDIYPDNAAEAGLNRRTFLNTPIASQSGMNMGAPGMGAPGMGAPGMGAPAMNMAGPGMGAPGMGAPGMGSGLQGMGAAPQASPQAFSPGMRASQEDYFYSLFYRREISASQLVELLGKLAASPKNSSAAELLAKMLRTLFLECRHFPRYPPVELHMTAEFFGLLINSEILLKRPELQLLAIRCVMEALRKDASTNIFKFGLVCLQQFLPNAVCSPAFLNSVLQMKSVSEHFPSVIRWVETCLSMMPQRVRNLGLADRNVITSAIAPNKFPPTQGVLVIPPHFALVADKSGPAAPVTTTVLPSVAFGTVSMPTAKECGEKYKVKLQGFGLGQVERLLEDPVITSQIVFPPMPVQIKTSQIFNSLVRTNAQQKAADLLSVLQSEWLAWLAYYIVKTRALKEVNHHELYAFFAEALGQPKMLEMLTNVTYDSINVLLKYVESAREAQCYRAVLKTLGSWLGLLTLARNRPLHSRSFDVKHHIYDAYERGNLAALVPLVCAVLSHSKSSRVFRPPNPWLMSCLTTLGSLHQVSRIKQTIVFEIELLIGELQLDLQHFIETGSSPNPFLSLRAPVDSPDFQPSSDSAPPAADSGMLTPPAALIGNPQADLGRPLLNALMNSALISPNLATFHAHPDLRVAVPIAVERAVRELVGIISERAVVLAVGTTVELVTKDFCREPDELLVKRAAHLMAASLGGSIVMVTGRSPLRAAIKQHVNDMIKTAANDEVIEQTAQVVAQDNLPLASSLIEQVVIEQAVKSVQTALAASLEARRRAAEKNEPFADPQYFNSNSVWPAALPPMLALNPGMDSQHLQIYKDFAQIGPLKRMREAAAVRANANESAQIVSPASVDQATPSVVDDKKKISLDDALEGINAAINGIKDTVKRIAASEEYKLTPTTTLIALLPPDHDFTTRVETIVSLIQNCERPVSLHTVRICLYDVCMWPSIPVDVWSSKTVDVYPFI